MYMRNAKRIGEITVMEVARIGVRTRAQALAMEDAATSRRRKKRKLPGGVSNSSSRFLNSGRRRSEEMSPENSLRLAPTQYAERSTDWSPNTSSCNSSSNPWRLSDLSKERSQVTDLEDENSTCNFSCAELNHSSRRETTPSSELEAESGELESTARPSQANSPMRSTVEKMPSETELEEFFLAAEHQIQKQFKEKYNFDVVNDLPLEGRYEWVQTKP